MASDQNHMNFHEQYTKIFPEQKNILRISNKTEGSKGECERVLEQLKLTNPDIEISECSGNAITSAMEQQDLMLKKHGFAYYQNIEGKISRESNPLPEGQKNPRQPRCAENSQEMGCFWHHKWGIIESCPDGPGHHCDDNL